MFQSKIKCRDKYAPVIAVQTLVSWKISQATIYVEKKTIYGDYYVRTRAVSGDDDCGMLVKLKAGKLFADVKIRQMRLM